MSRPVSNQSRQWQEGNRQQAEDALAHAIKIAGLSPHEFDRLSLGSEIGDDYTYEYTVPPWRLYGPYRTDPKAPAAAHFLKSGEHWDAATDSTKALRCFHWGRWAARAGKGDEYRRIEIRCTHMVAYVHLGRGEDISLSEAERISAKALFARYTELEGFLELTYGDPHRSAELYGNAAHRYYYTDEYKRLARAYLREAEILQSLGDRKGAVRALECRAGYLLMNDQADLELRGQGLASMFRAAGLLFGVQGADVNAAEIAREAARLALEESDLRQHAMDAFWPSEKERALVPERALTMTIISETLNNARKALETAGEFREADQCHALLSRLRRQSCTAKWWTHAHPIYLFSHLLDFVWGYGTRPLRIIPLFLVTTVMFALLYLLAGDVQWNGEELANSSNWGSRVTAALALSFSSIIPVHLVQQFSDSEVLSLPEVGTVSLVAVWLESLIGSALLGMLAFWIGRWYRRQYLPK